MVIKRCGGLAVLALLLIPMACAPTPRVRTNSDPSANLSLYKTYAFASQPGTNRNGTSTPFTSYFEDSISRQMDARGYRKVDSEPDLLVNFSTNVQERTDLPSSPSAMGQGYYGYRAGMYASPDIRALQYRIGTANIDVADARHKKLLWEGVAEGELTAEMLQNADTAIDKVVAEMFAKFPGHAAP